ncbi:hypothetical protein ACFE04_006489 [Oxalis oulophora]
MDPPKHPSSMRVLTRPSPPTGLTPPLPLPNRPHHPPPPPPLDDGVVVVGFISHRPEDSSNLINRVIDVNAFGSGQLDTVLSIDSKEELNDWFKSRRISYYKEEDKGILFLQFCPGFENGSGHDSDLLEFTELQGMLFMFTVCHVIVYIQQGSRFHTQNLSKFRVLQGAKNALVPFVRSMLPLPSRPRHLMSKNSSPGRTSGVGDNGMMLSRNSSSASLMSGVGSYSSLLPGQCTPVLLFVFMDDFYESTSSDDLSDTSTSTINHSSSLPNLGRPSLPPKNSGSVVVLSRPPSKPEGGFRKKLQQSLEGQIRFLIKKCRTLSGFEGSHFGPRTTGPSSLSPLFSLDATKAVVLLDKSSNQRSESLEFVTGLLEDVLNGKATSDSLLLETHSHNAPIKEDINIISIKEFIFKQCDILRGRAGSASTASGVGMVAVALAAAAASVTSGKSPTTLELPNLESWLSSSKIILNGVLSAKGGCLDEIKINKRKPRQRNPSPTQVEPVATRSSDPLDIAVSWLEGGKGLNTKFSTSWCEKSLPAAKNVYLKGLPACYPTSQHESHLKKALLVFQSMVRGSAVDLFAKKLEDECTNIWKAGRQLCDAVSLTGKPCQHQRHSVEPHSSGYIFLQACACGRSRKLRPDPFDFESANNVVNCFLDCDNLLPALKLPEVSSQGPVGQCCWSLVRVGGSRYYEPSKGLLQSGFCVTQKFLFKWIIFLEKPKSANPIRRIDSEFSANSSNMDPNFDINRKNNPTSGSQITGIQAKVGPEEKSSNSNDNSIRFGRVLHNFTMKKPFSEVVAGKTVTDSGFPPLQVKKQSLPVSEKSTKQIKARNHNSQKAESISFTQDTFPSFRDAIPILQVRNINGAENIKLKNSALKHVKVYVGFEHECPHGHRFLLNPDHFKEFGSSYPLMTDLSKSPSKAFQNSAQSKIKDVVVSKEKVANGNEFTDGLIQNSTSVNRQNDLETSGLQSVGLDDCGSDFSLLDKNLPLYMNCPHCKLSMVTPPFPVVLATCPAIQFESSCLPPSVPDREQKLHFTLGCQVILPPDSFLTLRLPFVYGVQLGDGNIHPLNPFEHHPELTAWLLKGTTLAVMSKGSSLRENT